METTQEVFDRVITAFFINGAKPGWNAADDACVYFDERTEARCALGIAIPLKAARFLGGKTVSAGSVSTELTNDYPSVAAFVAKHIKLLQMLQGSHDRAARLCNAYLPKFRERFKHYVLKYAVETKVPVDLTILKEWEEGS